MHTPGKWTVWTSEQYAKFYNNKGPFHKFYIVAEDDDPDGPWHIADIPGGLEDGEEAANARLIAAAPELLAALRQIVHLPSHNPHLTIRERLESVVEIATNALEEVEPS